MPAKRHDGHRLQSARDGAGQLWLDLPACNDAWPCAHLHALWLWLNPANPPLLQPAAAGCPDSPALEWRPSCDPPPPATPRLVSIASMPGAMRNVCFIPSPNPPPLNPPIFIVAHPTDTHTPLPPRRSPPSSSPAPSSAGPRTSCARPASFRMSWPGGSRRAPCCPPAPS